MSQIQVPVSVEAKTYELSQALVKFTGAIKQALADGWQPGSDIPLILSAAFVDLVPVIKDIGAFPDEIKEDKVAFAMSWVLSAKDFAATMGA